ncbi:efflux RND transporter periplasmic adaptor subunit [Maridesulfovibrio hydrothermalis]|uniref:Efflux transporter, RND family, MFP subunit n=1 Tax=Maridesulfovibrio hydrothermalis AM13 = DSM 14728 TaxID=1121451 RepID=L0RBX0_9BACT|nr:efflux RND transporter periplasmic adaptor subunit [Maridesulfovibrio hydrothermalis]CCO23046.1 Efflux transporter, RND family, MFP subunit [Maridesulfovibrio hydrothermalis AM13 = DSM 14728]
MKMKRSYNLIYLFLFLMLAGFVAVPQVQASAAKTFKAEAASRVITLTGFTRPRVSMTLVSEESAVCTKVYADIGDTISANGRFADLDPTFVKLEIAQLAADKERLQSDVTYYSKEADRYRKLVKKSTASQSELDLHIRNLKNAESRLRFTQLELNIEREHLRRYTLRAPGGWRVIKRYIEPGEWVTKGEKVAELGNFKTLLVPYALTVKELEKIRAMAGKLTLRLPDLNIEVFAELERISPDFDPETRKVEVDFEIEKGDFKFRGGLRTELDVDLPDPGGTVLVPQSAVVKAYDDNFIVRPDGVRVKVLVLGSVKDGRLRVSSRAVKSGEEFLLRP